MKIKRTIRVEESSKSEEMSKILGSFGIKFLRINVDEGNYFDEYDIEIPRGVRFSKIENILTDIGIYLRACKKPEGFVKMRKGAYCIRVQKEEMLSPDMMPLILKNLDDSRTINMTVGVGSSGEAISFDLNLVPNILIGGTTGSGKSVLMHNLIMNCIIQGGVDIRLVDPKRVEFSMYENKIFGKVYKTIEEFKNLLSELEMEMNSRYILFERYGVRNISEYNNTFPNRKLNSIVTFIDEWADLSMSDSSVQFELCKIAQKCRASGISIVLATQRPSSDVISGIIKANFPGRIALRVASNQDSRVILDTAGAENLKGKGNGYINLGDGNISVFRTGFIPNIPQELECLPYRKQ